jgi:hypothetical protein
MGQKESLWCRYGIKCLYCATLGGFALFELGHILLIFLKINLKGPKKPKKNLTPSGRRGIIYCRLANLSRAFVVPQDVLS